MMGIVASSVVLSPRMAALHGMMCSDGTLYCGLYGRLRPKWRYAVQLAEPERTIRSRFAGLVFELYGLQCKESNERGIIRAYGRDMALNLQKLGPFGHQEWHVPIDKLDRVSASMWLRSYFDGDGDVHLGERIGRCMVRARSVNREGLIGVQRLLSSQFGIESRLYLHGKPKRETWSQSYDLDVFRAKDLLAFAAEIGFTHPRKRAKLTRVVALIQSREGAV